MDYNETRDHDIFHLEFPFAILKRTIITPIEVFVVEVIEDLVYVSASLCSDDRPHYNLLKKVQQIDCHN